MVKFRVRKNRKLTNVEPFEFSEDEFGVILIINDTPSSPWNGYEWIENFRNTEEADYDAHNIRRAYEGMPVFIYITSKKSIVADAVIDNIENNVFHLVNLRLMDHPDIIGKDELIKMKIFKKVPQLLKYISKTDYENIESLFKE